VPAAPNARQRHRGQQEHVPHPDCAALATGECHHLERDEEATGQERVEPSPSDRSADPDAERVAIGPGLGGLLRA
jgi:hypothetical protein